MSRDLLGKNQTCLKIRLILIPVIKSRTELIGFNAKTFMRSIQLMFDKVGDIAVEIHISQQGFFPSSIDQRKHGSRSGNNYKCAYNFYCFVFHLIYRFEVLIKKSQPYN